MADAPAAPVVEEPNNEGTPIVPTEVSDWGNEATFTEPIVKTETGKEVVRDEDKPIVEEPGVTTGEGTTEGTEPAVTPPVPTAPAVQDPGEFKPQDYSFETVIKGKATKITTPDEADALAADPENFETPQQLMDFIRKSNKMENGIEKDKTAWEQIKKSFDEQTAVELARAEEINTISAEVNYLVQRGDLPPIAKEYQNANWGDPVVAGQPGVREQLALLKYMGEENGRRAKAGLKSTVSALDAYNGWKIEEAKAKADKDGKAEGKARRDAGARVAGPSAAPIANAPPKGVKVGRIVGDLNSLGNNWNNQ